MEHITISKIATFISILKEALGDEITDEKLNKEKLNTIINYVEPYIFGGTPMCAAIASAVEVFNSNCQEKILFIITDGKSTDGDPMRFAQILKNLNVTVIVCLLSSKNLNNPRQLYYNPEANWSYSTKQMFNLATAVDNSHPMLSVLLERGWDLAMEGESKLFIQANHPDIISEIGEIISTKNNDPFLNIVARVSLEEYININPSNTKPPKQVGGTCYANASATVIRLSLKRIYKREGGIVSFEKLRKNMIADFGTEGAITQKVVEKYCAKYRLQYRKINENEAKIAVSRRRPVIATFRLHDNQWDNFSNFYESNKKGILKKKNLDSPDKSETSGHAVVLMKVAPDHLLFMNSWGENWADGGFFRVENASVLDLQFYDVFWTLNNLTSGEKAAYEELKSSGASFIDKIPASIKSLPYTCPKCNQSSPANKFKGNFKEANCPKCGESFTPLILGFTIFN